MEIQWLLLCQSLFYFFILYFLFRQFWTSDHHNLPPGPRKLPLIGNLHHLSGALPHHALRALARKHGPLMSLKLGELRTVVVSSSQLAEQITRTNDAAFAGRVELMLPRIVLYNSSDMASAQYGEYWRTMRKLCILEFLNHRKIRGFFGLMQTEVLRMVDRLNAESSAGDPVNVTEKILSVECGIICRATVGRVWTKDQETSLIRIIKEAVAIAGVFNFVDVFPSMKLLHFVSVGSRRKLERMHERIDAVLEEIIEHHRDKKMCVNGDDVEEDMIDIFLRARASKRLRIPITRDNIKANIFEMFIAGIETSSLVIEWGMSEMIKNPRVLRKAQQEVRRVLDGKEIFEQMDIEKLSYLKTVIKETLRLHPPGPLLCPRRCREQSRIDGYDIPVNTIVMINVWAIGRDPDIWLDPEKFIPERFEHADIDYKGNHFELIPFGAGRRICPGISFGIAGVELSLAHLLYHFDWGVPDDAPPEDLDMTENFGASAGRKNNLCLIATRRGESIR
ncbi:premnaspirodiene oxygenase-like [Andrographis paniculata]|uniref:premnaspirodiene oxygenase-like n=1 Tax=Andrographis paniculata TaxID=175694 RepID=UPI0021E7CAA0|nr:premnaspirodiene oxygenase-like [Andrographis paniculata]